MKIEMNAKEIMDKCQEICRKSKTAKEAIIEIKKEYEEAEVKVSFRNVGGERKDVGKIRLGLYAKEIYF